MFAKGPMPGATPIADALALLPAGTIASAGNANIAWEKALSWALRYQPPCNEN